MAVPYNHVYLYAKGWYKSTNVLKDLRVIVAHHTAVDWERVSAYDVLDVLFDLVYANIGNESRFSILMHKIVDNKDMVSQIQTMLSLLSMVKGTDFGHPDGSILPLAG